MKKVSDNNNNKIVTRPHLDVTQLSSINSLNFSNDYQASLSIHTDPFNLTTEVKVNSPPQDL